VLETPNHQDTVKYHLPREKRTRVVRRQCILTVRMNWKAIAIALEVPLEERDLPRVVTPLEALDRAFRPLQPGIPFDAPLWDGPE
jgi:hypothetical protein